jgi:hypothetical protein
MFSIRPRNHCAVNLLGLPNGRSQIEPIHAWHAERGHLRDDQDQDRVAALEADR